MYTFLAALPASLGLAGFVIFQILRSQHRGDTITSKIVEKLRADHPDNFKEHDQLTSRQLHDLLKQDQELRMAIGQQDFELLGQTLRQQHTQAMFVYTVTAALFIVGVVAFLYQLNRPEPTTVSNISLESAAPEANGLLVDLDDFRVTWQGSGVAAPVKIYAENIDTGARTDFLNARSTDGELIFKHEEYQAIIANRGFAQSNRIRIVAQADSNSFFSEEYSVAVGSTIIAVVFDERVKIGAMIDNSLVDGYKFEFTMVTPRKGEVDFLTLGGEVSGARDFPNQNDPSFDWGKSNIVYLGPDDPRLFRTEVFYDVPD